MSTPPPPARRWGVLRIVAAVLVVTLAVLAIVIGGCFIAFQIMAH